MEHFNVVQFFVDESYEYVQRGLDIPTAVLLALRLTRSVGGKIGTTQRIIITDSGDQICWEWKFGQDVVFPLLRES